MQKEAWPYVVGAALAGGLFLLLRGGNAVARVARRYDGVCVNADPETYLDLVGPDETDSMRQAMRSMWGSGLSVRGFWREAGVDHPLLEAPYQIGQAYADILQIAKDAGAWGPPTLKANGDPNVKPGDFVLTGPEGGPEHGYTVVGVSGNDITSVDGGQTDAQGGQCIRSMRRSWSGQPGALYDHGEFYTRRIVGVADVDKVLGAFG